MAKGNTELKKLIIDLGKISKETKAELRTGMRKIATPTLNKAKARAALSSTRIPAATRLSIGFTQRSAGVRMLTDRKRAPHARPFEHGGKPGFFRHPVFGRDSVPRSKWTWVSQRAHPYMWPTAVDDLPEIGGRMLDLCIGVATKNGFHNSP